jgi:hypothetical protein
MLRHLPKEVREVALHGIPDRDPTPDAPATRAGAAFIEE